eukprot:TRINITY_DN2704_c0_g2_i2.p1 TRINITY_DN2704_c0_g2~~TRINITY_DN2704_c0_g2_i2.p1  ORF type:complete len:206 (-),score=48.05 TRINITY_DN2704_c0_g2_i2:112-729(-)
MDMSAKYTQAAHFSPEALSYILTTGNREHPVLTKLRLATSTHQRSVMMTTPEQILLFQFLSKALNVQKVIEVGVFTGYGTLGMALALPEQGKIVGCDVSAEYPEVGKPFWEEAQVTKKIDLRIGAAVDTIEELLKNGEEGSFDFGYIDADKNNYDRYYEGVLRLLKKGGIVAIDNVMWSEKVLKKADSEDEETAALIKLNSREDT